VRPQSADDIVHLMDNLEELSTDSYLICLPNVVHVQVGIFLEFWSLKAEKIASLKVFIK